MSSDLDAAWHASLDLLIPHAALPLLAVTWQDGGPGIPRLELRRHVWPNQLGVTAAEVAQQFGLAAYGLRTAFGELRLDERYVRYGQVLELHAPGDALPAGWRWAARAELAHAQLDQPLSQAVDALLGELEQGCVPAMRPPWARPGWLAGAERWIRQQLGSLGFTQQGPIEQVKHWSISCVLRAPCAEGSVYFKAASRQAPFASEPLLLEALARRFPANIPRPLASERDQHWVLLADFGGPLEDTSDVAVWEGALAAYGQIQGAATNEIDALLTAGCRDRRLGVLEAQIEPLLAAAEVRCRLRAEELAALQAAAPRLRALCRQLQSYRIPASLVHGDLHFGNIAHQAGRYLFYDWTTACIAHPFFDLANFAHVEGSSLPAPQAWPRLLEDYLLLWSAYEPVKRLHQAWRLAQPLAVLHQLISFQQAVSSLEPAAQGELGWGVNFWAGKLLEALRAPELADAGPGSGS